MKIKSLLVTVILLISVPAAAQTKKHVKKRNTKIKRTRKISKSSAKIPMCQAYSIIAKEKKAKLPSNLKKFKKIFSKMPFKVFGSFTLKKKTSIPLKITGSKTLITKKFVMSLYLKDRILTSGNKLRYRLKLQIYKNTKSGKTSKNILIHNMVINLAAGKPMFIAGPKAENGTLVIGLFCSATK